jgi:hypothetical protein
MTKDEEIAKRLEKLQATLAAVQQPQADQDLVGYHRGRRPLAEEEVSQASSSGLILPGKVPKEDAPLVIEEGTTAPEVEMHERGVLSDEPEMPKPEVNVLVPSDEWVPSASGLNETLFDKLANLVESFRRPKASKRVAVAVSKDVFSRVSHLAFSRELDKIDILTFLLHRHLGDIKADKIPKWLFVESKGPNRVDYLSFLQTPDLAKKIALLQERLGMNKVDIVEKLVLQWLPRAPFTIPAKQRRKSTRSGAESFR